MGADMNDTPAFPLNTPKWHEAVSDKGFDGIDFTMGMSLRDYFAAKAMQSFLVDQCHDAGQWDLEAKAAYKVADAMLEARDGKD